MKGVKNITRPCHVVAGARGEGLVTALNKVWQKLSAVFAQTHTWSSVVRMSLCCFVSFVSFQVLESVELELISVW